MSTITIGNIHRITKRVKHNGELVTHVFEAVITGAEQRPGVESTYFSYTPCGLNAHLHGAFGEAWLYPVPKPYGVQHVEDTGRKLPQASHWYPNPGDRGYDLMC